MTGSLASSKAEDLSLEVVGLQSGGARKGSAPYFPFNLREQCQEGWFPTLSYSLYIALRDEESCGDGHLAHPLVIRNVSFEALRR